MALTLVSGQQQRAFGLRQGLSQPLEPGRGGVDDDEADDEGEQASTATPALPPSDSTLCFDPRRLPHDFLLRQRHFWPRASSLHAAETVQDGEADALAVYIRRRQRPPSCRKAGLAVTITMPSGFGSTLMGTLKPLMHAHRRGLALLSPPLAAFAPAEHCPPHTANSFACFFERLVPRCERAFHRAAGGLGPEDPGAEAGAKAGVGAGADSEMVTEALLAQVEEDGTQRRVLDPLELVGAGSYTRHGPRVLPRRWRPRGLFFFVARYLAFLLRPNAAVRAALRRAKQELGWARLRGQGRGPLIAMHVRNGDSCLRREEKRMARKCHGLSSYMVAARRARELYGARTIFLATDSQAVLDEARSGKHAGFRFVVLGGVDRGEKQRGKIWDELLEEGYDLDWHREASNVLLDMLLLSEGDLFIGKFTSNVFRTAYALSHARTGCVKPFVSLDGPWCFDFGMPNSGIGEGGRRYCLSEAPDVRVLHLCRSFVVVDKPPDMRIDGDAFDVTLEKVLQRQLARDADYARPTPGTGAGEAAPGAGPPAPPRLRFVHRLDFATSGVICLALDRAAAGMGARLFRERRVRKEYVAMVWGTMPRVPPPGSGGGGASTPTGAVPFGCMPPAPPKRSAPGGGLDGARGPDGKRIRGADGKRVRGRVWACAFFEREVARLQAAASTGGGAAAALTAAEQRLLQL
eukprot:g5480.t1